MIHARMSIFNALLKLFAVLLFTCLGLLVWSKYWELPGVFYQNLPFPVEVEQVMSGETVPLNVERCNRTSKVLSYLTTHTLVNLDTGAAELLPDVTLSIDPGCHRVSQRLNLIPRETTSGRYMLKGVALIPGLFEIHPIPWYSEQFIVVASSGSDKTSMGNK